MNVVPTLEPRFEFGRNWWRFLSVLNEERILAAERSLKAMLGADSLAGKTFLDVGSGSGLFSLAATRLGARRVHSFDYDAESVACTRELMRRYCPHASCWTVEQGSALDKTYLHHLGQWDVVYSWGVLHHTGDMWQALENVVTLVAPEGFLYISIYNDQGKLSRFWKGVKFFYNQGSIAQVITLALFLPAFVLGAFVMDVLHGTSPLRRYRNLGRGMSIVFDWIDWLGGYPFEVARPDQIVGFYRERGLELCRSITVGRKSACNEFVFGKQ